MAERQWKLEVTDLGGRDTLHEAVVRAATWVSALEVGRRTIGEEGSIPAGASCQVAPDGIVTVFDVIGRRSYQLTPVSSADALAFAKASSAPPQAPVSAQPAPGSSAPPPPPPAAVAQSTPRTDSPRPSSPPTEAIAEAVTLVNHRDQEPTETNPLTFRERMYAVTVPLHPGTAEQLAVKLLRRLQAELAGRRGAKFVHIAIFDHDWTDQPRRPPVVRLQWKDWRRTIDIEFPLEDATRTSERPGASSMPPAPTEDRLAIAFEASRDLLFMNSRAEALEFGIRLIDELIPSDAAAACLFDINTDEFRFVATSGMGAAKRHGQAVKSDQGLFGAAASLNERNLLQLADAHQDERFDPQADGISGLEIHAALYLPLMFEGRLLGMLQLLNGPAQGLFSEGDCEVLSYVGEQLSAFIAEVRSRPPGSPQQRSFA